MRKNKQPTEKNNPIPRRIIAREVQERLKNNPGSFTDSDVVEAIKKLQDYCVRGTARQSKRAREILSRLLIPEGSDTRKTDNKNLAFWKKQSEILVQLVDYFETLMRPGWDKGKTKKERREKAFKCLLGRYPTEEEYRELIKEGHTVRDRNFRDFGLSCFAFIEDISFSSLKKFCNSNKVKEERFRFLDSLKPYAERVFKGVKMSDLEVVTMRGSAK